MQNVHVTFNFGRQTWSRLILGHDANMFDKSLAAVVGPIYFFCQIWAILGQTIFATWEAIIAYLLCPIVLLVKTVSAENWILFWMSQNVIKYPEQWRVTSRDIVPGWLEM